MTSLDKDKSLDVACIIDANDSVLAAYSPNGSHDSKLDCNLRTFQNASNAHLLSETQVVVRGETIGKIVLVADVKRSTKTTFSSLQSALPFVLLAAVLVSFVCVSLCNYALKSFHDLVWLSRAYLKGEVLSFPDSASSDVASIGKALNYASRRVTDMEVSLRNAIKDEEEASRVKSEFLANMSHELRTPLNGVIATTSLLADTPLSLEQQSFVKTISLSSDALLAVVDDVLDISRLEVRSIQLHEEPLDLLALCYDVCKLLAEGQDSNRVGFVLVMDYQMNTFLLGDEKRIRQVLNNLICNALKFTEEGHVYVGLRCHRYSKSHSTVELVVRDTGVGIKEQNLSEIFDKFSQVDMSSTRSRGGVGLGLAICRHLVNLMGGAISVKSEAGQGSQFQVRITLRNIKPIGSTYKFPDLSNHAVFLVEPNYHLRILLANQLQSLSGINVIAFEELDAFCNQIKDIQPKCVLLAEELWSLYKPKLRKRLDLVEQRDQYSTILMVTAAHRRRIVVERADGAVAVHSRPLFLPRLLKEIQLALVEGRPSTVDLTEFAPRGSQSVTEMSSELQKEKTRVLLVEDNVINQKVTCAILAKMNCEVAVADHGQAALDVILEDSAFELIFMDCQMPIMDGYEATPLIKEMYSTMEKDAPPIIALTAHSLSSDREKCLNAGMDDYLTKPFTSDSLVKITNKWLKKSSLPSV